MADNSSKNAVQISANGANINGFIITGATGHYHDPIRDIEIGYSGIYIGADNCTIINNVLAGNALGICLSGVSNNLLEKNNISDNNMDGILFENYSHYNKIFNNTIKNNGQGYPSTGNFSGIYIRDSASNQLIDNNVTENRADGIFMISSSRNNIQRNNVTNNGHYGIELNSLSSRNIIQGNDVIENVYWGIEILNSFENLISGNTVNKNGYAPSIYRYGGIDLEWSEKNNITGNIIQNNSDYGISLHEDSSENIISGNNIFNNNNYGIEIYGSSSISNQILYNVISNCTQGIASSSVNTTITGNNISDCTSWGIHISGSTGDNVIGNTIKSSKIGIEILNALNTQLRNNIMENNTYNFGVNAGGAFSLTNYQTMNIDQSNTVNGKPIYYIVGQNGGTFDSSMNIGYLALISCQNVQVNSLQLSNNIHGVLLAGTNNTNIQNCEFSSNDDGISIKRNSTGNIISGNEFTNDSIALESSSNNQIINNIITRTSGIPDSIGIIMASASDNQITGNTISNTNYGVYLSFDSRNNLLNLNVITNNIIGIYLWRYRNLAQPTENRIIQNTITGNQVGINTTPSDNEAHFNLISGNSLFGIVNTNTSNFNATNNYWGSGDDPNKLISGPVETSPYMVLRISASPSIIPINSKSTITADLRYDSEGNYHDPSSGHIPDGTMVEFSTDIGSLETKGTTSTEKPTVNAMTTTTLISDIVSGEATVTGKIGNDTKQTTVTIEPAADLYVNVNVDKNNVNPGDIIYITFKVGNKGNMVARNTLITFSILNGLQFINASSPDGYNNFIFDNKTNTITWNMGDLPNVDPTLIIAVRALEIGIYTLKPGLSTTTYDPNLLNSIGSAIINVQQTSPNNNAATTTTAVRTMPMQSTGIPLGALIIALLMVLGGIYRAKEK